jgi:hypothetical protein
MDGLDRTMRDDALIGLTDKRVFMMARAEGKGKGRALLPGLRRAQFSINLVSP